MLFYPSETQFTYLQIENAEIAELLYKWESSTTW